MRAKASSWKILIFLLSLPFYLYMFLKVSFLPVFGELPLQYILVIVAAAFLIGFFAHDIAGSFLVFALSLVSSVIIIVLLVRVPVDMFMGSTSGSFAMIFALKGILTYALFLVAPFSIPSVIAGCYVRERTLGEIDG